jgi:hypothetical protein
MIFAVLLLAITFRVLMAVATHNRKPPPAVSAGERRAQPVGQAVAGPFKQMSIQGVAGVVTDSPAQEVKEMKLSSTGRRVLFALGLPAAVTAAALTAAVPAQASTRYNAGSCTARGQYATCVAGGNATRPSTIRVHVTTNASQWVTVYWSDVCSKGTGAGSASGHFSVYDRANTTVGHNIWHPYRYPDSCSVAADAQINHGSYLHLSNTYYRW